MHVSTKPSLTRAPSPPMSSLVVCSFQQRTAAKQHIHYLMFSFCYSSFACKFCLHISALSCRLYFNKNKFITVNIPFTRLVAVFSCILE